MTFMYVTSRKLLFFSRNFRLRFLQKVYLLRIVKEGVEENETKGLKTNGFVSVGKCNGVDNVSDI